MTSFPIPKTAGLFWIRSEDWGAYVSLCTDGDKLPTPYEDWVLGAERVTQNLAWESWDVIQINGDLVEFAARCKANDLNVDKARRREAISSAMRPRNALDIFQASSALGDGK